MPEISNDTSNPFLCTSFVHGSFHQGDGRFSVFTRGNQCTINSLCALIYTHFSQLESSNHLDELHTIGDKLYKTLTDNLKQLGKFKHRLLCLDEIPDHAVILSKNVDIQKAEIVSGVAVQHSGDSALPSLHCSLENAFTNKDYVLVMIGAVCSAVFKKANNYWLFDSHSHSNNGLSGCDGKSVLISFACLNDLLTFLYAIYDSMKIDLSCQYEILPVSFTTRNVKKGTHSDLFIKYFEDQNEKLDKFHQTLESKSLKSNRLEYRKIYMRNKRNDPDFKRKEKNHSECDQKKSKVQCRIQKKGEKNAECV